MGGNQQIMVIFREKAGFSSVNNANFVFCPPFNPSAGTEIKREVRTLAARQVETNLIKLDIRPPI